MNAILNIRAVALFLGWMASPLTTVRADIEVRVSVKYIHTVGSATPPSGNIGTPAGFAQEITSGNQILAATGRGYSLKVVEYSDIQPPVPAGGPVNVTGGTTRNSATVTCGNTTGLVDCMAVQGTGIPSDTVILSFVPNTSFTMSANATATNASTAITASYPANYWFTLPARAKRQLIETAALASQGVWGWNASAINIYINNSTSGSCSFVGQGSSIALGGLVEPGTVLHEVGHLFNLRHTHAGDYTNNTDPEGGAFTLADLQDGDALDETTLDNPNLKYADQLSVALFDHDYAAATIYERATVDSAFQNVMSYHNEVTLLQVQMDIWTLNANGPRLFLCNGRTWFVASGPGGNDNASGANSGVPLRTIAGAFSHVSTANDVVLLNTGSYAAPTGGTMTTPCTLRATRGEVTVHFP